MLPALREGYDRQRTDASGETFQMQLLVTGATGSIGSHLLAIYWE